MTNVMVVDDDLDVLESTKKMLQLEGHKVLLAASGPECLAKLEVEKPDYIFLDIDMPEMNGWETLAKIRENGKLRDVPVSMLTAVVFSAETVKNCDTNGLVDYITKPFTKEDVLETLKQVDR